MPNEGWTERWARYPQYFTEFEGPWSDRQVSGEGVQTGSSKSKDTASTRSHGKGLWGAEQPAQ